MTDEQKTTRGNQGTFETASRMAMMEKMMSGQREGCGFAGMISQGEGLEEIPSEWLELMSQMRGSFCETQEEGYKTNKG